MIGVLNIVREPTDGCGCCHLKLHYYPNGHVGDRNDYAAGELYLREGDANSLIEALRAQGLWWIQVIT